MKVLHDIPTTFITLVQGFFGASLIHCIILYIMRNNEYDARYMILLLHTYLFSYIYAIYSKKDRQVVNELFFLPLILNGCLGPFYLLYKHCYTNKDIYGTFMMDIITFRYYFIQLEYVMFLLMTSAASFYIMYMSYKMINYTLERLYICCCCCCIPVENKCY